MTDKNPHLTSGDRAARCDLARELFIRFVVDAARVANDRNEVPTVTPPYLARSAFECADAFFEYQYAWREARADEGAS